MGNCNCGRRHCLECEVPQLARNTYFPGKLMVTRDFCDEQRYFQGKQMRHNRNQHGCGTVCGLKVVEHQDPNCRDRFVVVRPGTAIDCCGHEILLQSPQVFDFRSCFESLYKEKHPEALDFGDRRHLIQVCLRYSECETEDVPALFDDCGCSQDGCQPNRILETFELDLRIDPPDDTDDPSSLRLDWESTVNVAGAHRVAVDDANHLLYVLTTAEPARLFVASTTNYNVIHSHTFHGEQGLDVAVAPGGERVYVALHDAGSKEAPEIHVYDEENLRNPINSIPFEGAAGGRVRLAVAPDGRLLALNQRREEVWLWGEEINHRLRHKAHHEVAATGEHPTDLAVSPSGHYAYVSNRESESLTAIPLADPDAPVEISVAGIKPSALDVASVQGEDKLIVLDAASETLHYFDWHPHATQPDQRLEPIGDPVTQLAHDPNDVAITPGGKWAFVLSEDVSNESYVQAVDLHAVQLHRHHVSGRPYRVGDESHDLEIGDEGLTLYVPFSSEEGGPEGGVAVIELGEENCEGLFEKILDGCDDCDDCDCGDCVVLATVEGYLHGEKLDDERIDNLRDRRLLPSTELMTEVVQCMLESGWESGSRGEVGPPGPRGEPGPPGKGVSSDYAHIVAINWVHAGQNAGLDHIAIAFDREIEVADLGPVVGHDYHPQSFALLRGATDPKSGDQSFSEVQGSLDVGTVAHGDLSTYTSTPTAASANAFKFAPPGPLSEGDWRVVIHGDLIRDSRGLAADLDFLPNPRGKPWDGTTTGDGIEGGDLYSYFSVSGGGKSK